MKKQTNKIQAFIKLIRVKQYVKNILIFLPLFFSGSFFDGDTFVKTLIGFVLFCLVASVVYVTNDLNDIEKDKKHPKKKYRPLASGAISKRQAIGIVSVMLALTIAASALLLDPWALMLMATYLVMNIVYSTKLKHTPLVDVAIIAAGFYIRLLYGGVVSGIPLSIYILLTVLFLSLFMGFGKRRNELIHNGVDSRKVLKYYSKDFLDKNMYVMVALSLAFYALWVISAYPKDQVMMTTIPLVTFLMIRYSFVIEQDTSDGDPSEVLLSDKTIMILGLLVAIVMAIGVYV